MVALSVSTSARISPDLTLSPTFFCQEAMMPSVMVSLILGMRITVALTLAAGAAGAGAASDLGVGAGSAFGAGADSAAGALAPPPEAWFNNPDISSPSLPIMAKTPSTGTDSFSFGPI